MAAAQQPSFWQQLELLAATHPDVIKHVATHLPGGGAAHLRGASRCVRDALNRTVTTVRWTPGGRFGGVEMAAVFPGACRLHASLLHSDVDDIVASSPVLLQKIQHLELKMPYFPNHPGDDGAGVARLLPRCASGMALGSWVAHD
jgi:hypothetical protein